VSDAGGTPELTPQQHRAILALLELPTRAKVAAAVGVDASTLYRWMRQAAFKAELRRARQVPTDEVALALVRLGRRATRTLKLCLQGRGKTVQLKAACFVIAQLTGLQASADLEAEMLDLRARLERRNAGASASTEGDGSEPPGDGGERPDGGVGEGDPPEAGD
jgi:transposase-like protein